MNILADNNEVGYLNISHLKLIWNGFRKWRVLLILLIISILPYLFLSYFVTPAADDFCYASSAISNGAIAAQINLYRTWNGRYATTFVQMTAPLIGDYLETYKFYPMILLLLTFFSLWTFFSSLFFHRLFCRTTILPALLVFAVYINEMPSAMEGFYWLSSAYTYQFPICTGLFSLTLLFLHAPAKNTNGFLRFLQMGLLVILGFVTVGCSEIVAFIFLSVLFMGCVNSSISSSPGKWLWRICFLVSSIGFIIVVSAPGNVCRSEFFPHRHNIPITTELSAGRAIFLFNQILLSPLTWLAALLAFPYAKIVSRKYCIDSISSSSKIIICLYFLLVLSGMVILPAWAMGSELPIRTANPQFLALLGFGFGCMVLVIPYFPRKWCFLNRRHQAFLSISVFFLAFLLTQSRFPVAMGHLIIAPEYKKQWQKRYEVIAEAKKMNLREVALPPINYPYDPKTIAYYDISLDSKHFTNQGLAKYFNLDKVVMKIPPEILKQNTSKNAER